jgi:hypothetical protein
MGTVARLPCSSVVTRARVRSPSALGDRRRLEPEPAPLLRTGIYLEPFALRALGIVRGDKVLMEQAIARFEAMALDWHADQTRMVFT